MPADFPPPPPPPPPLKYEPLPMRRTWWHFIPFVVLALTIPLMIYFIFVVGPEDGRRIRAAAREVADVCMAEKHSASDCLVVCDRSGVSLPACRRYVLDQVTDGR